MESSKRIYLLGASFRVAPVAVREGLRFQPGQAASLLRAAVAARPGLEALVLSTCNRTEFYLAAPEDCNATGCLLALLREMRPDAPILHDNCHRYQLSSQDAVRHLFRVACGLDSAIPGDAQILGQIKAALNIAARSGSLGATLQQALTLAVRAGKRARTETRFGWGSASLGSAIADLLVERDSKEAVSDRLPQVLIIGAGEMARDIGRHLAKRGGRRLTFVNRTISKATQLAELCGGRGLGWHSLETGLDEADVVIAATACLHPILSRAMLKAALARRHGRPLLVLDAGVPRNIETGSAAELLNIDAIRERQEGALALRRAAIPEVERIVAEEMAAWEHWRSLRPVERMLKSLFHQVSDASREVAREISRAALVDAGAVERLVQRRLRGLLRPYARRLRQLPLPAIPGGAPS